MPKEKNFFCNRGDCIANKYFTCSALVEKNPVTGERLDIANCPFHMTAEQMEADKQTVIAKLREHGREDLIKKYWGLMNP